MAIAFLSESQIGAQETPDRTFEDWAFTEVFHVDNNHKNKGDDDQHGTEDYPWETIAFAARKLRAGQLAIVHEGTGIYVETERIESRAPGDKDTKAPIGIKVAEGAKVRVLQKLPLDSDNKKNKRRPIFYINHDYWILEGFELDLGANHIPPLELPPITGVSVYGSHVLLKDLHIHDGVSSAAIYLKDAEDVTILGGELHHIREPEEDSYGILIEPLCNRVLIQGVCSFNNSGDSVQIVGVNDSKNPNVTPPGDGTGAAHEGDPKNITIENNHFHTDDENAVDIKSSSWVTVRNNTMHDYKARRNTSPQGDAIVVHISARNILIEGNTIYDCGRGIGIGAARNMAHPQWFVGNFVCRENTIHNIVSVPAEYDPKKSTPGDGIAVGTVIKPTDADPTPRVEIYCNRLDSIFRYAIRLAYEDQVDEVIVYKNTISNTPYAVDINTRQVKKLTSDCNEFHDPTPQDQIKFRIDGRDWFLKDWKNLGYESGDCKGND